MSASLQPVTQTECCEPATDTITISSEEAESSAQVFAALGDATRLKILNLLANFPTNEVCVCDITAAFSWSQPTISHHLKILRDAGLISATKRGKWVYYRLAPQETSQKVADLLAGVIASQPQLAKVG